MAQNFLNNISFAHPQYPYMEINLGDIYSDFKNRIGNGYYNLMGNLNGLARYLYGQPGYSDRFLPR